MNDLTEITAQGRRLFSISDRVDADREFKRWDDEVGEWLAERFPDTGLPAKWSSLGSSNLVWDNSVGSSQDEWIEFRDLVKERLKWLSEFPGISRTTGSSPTTKHILELPDKVTLAWLWEKVPAKFWVSFISLLVAAFVFGTTFGQVSWVRELYGDKSVRLPSDSEIGTAGKPIKVTLSNGEIHLPGPGFYLVDTEGDSSSGDLKRINGLKRGDQVIIAAASSERTVVVKKSPFLKILIDFFLNNEDDRIVFVCDGMNKCTEISRANN